MARSLFTGSNSGVQYFDIRPDQDHLVLRGEAHEASSVLLKGTLVLCITEPLKVQGVTLRFTGEARSALSYMTAAPAARFIKQESVFLQHGWSFDPPNTTKSYVLPAGNHEWPFELVLPGDLPESIEGCFNSWVIYRLKAVADRGLFARNLEARHHVRLIRTFDTSSTELLHAMSINNTWPDKITYAIRTPQKGVVFGSKVHVDFELAPLLKGLRIGKVHTSVAETVVVWVEPKGEVRRSREYLRVVAADEYELPTDMETEDIDGVEGYRFSRQLQLPHSLNACVQSVNEMNIVAKHQLKFVVSLHNPDGHVSELRAHLPIHLFISPNMRITEENALDLNGTNPVAAFDSTMTPPSYGDHQLDVLYTELDPRNYVTPSSSQLPSRDQSRRGSNEELDTLANDEVSANTLRNRLNLIRSEDDEDAEAAVRRFDVETEGDGDPSRSSSFVEGDSRAENPTTSHLLAQPTDQPSADYNAEALSRVPSYRTALHTSTRTPVAADLPDYQAAMSHPPSPSAPGSAAASISGTQPNDSSGEAGSSADGEPRVARHAHFAENPASEPRSTERWSSFSLPLRHSRRLVE